MTKHTHCGDFEPTDNEMSAKLHNAIQDVYVAFMESENAQAFAAAHPGQDLLLSVEIVIQSQKREQCRLVLQPDGLMLHSAEVKQ